jgi:hypothetical protein
MCSTILLAFYTGIALFRYKLIIVLLLQVRYRFEFSAPVSGLAPRFKRSLLFTSSIRTPLILLFISLISLNLFSTLILSIPLLRSLLFPARQLCHLLTSALVSALLSGPFIPSHPLPIIVDMRRSSCAPSMLVVSFSQLRCCLTTNHQLVMLATARPPVTPV